MQTTALATATPNLPLCLDVDVVKHEVTVGLKPETDPALESKADQFVQALLAVDPEDYKGRGDRTTAIDEMGLALQTASSAKSKMLARPMKDVVARSEDGGEVANSLVDLKIQVEALDPNKFDFEAGWLGRAVGGVFGSKLKRYFAQYESAQETIDAIIRSLNLGRDQLRRNNVTLLDDQIRLRELTLKLDKQIALGLMVDDRLQNKLDATDQEDPMYKFIAEELIFPLRQRIQDLQQQLGVNQQGVLALELLIRNNKELMRGVNRAVNVTVGALEIAVTVALALADQKIVLDKINALNSATNAMIAGTAKRLRTTAGEINKQASTTMLDMNTLKSAFGDVLATIDEISRYRLEACPAMRQAIVEMGRMTDAGERAIWKMEQGNRTAPALSLDIDGEYSVVKE